MPFESSRPLSYALTEEKETKKKRDKMEEKSKYGIQRQENAKQEKKGTKERVSRYTPAHRHIKMFTTSG